MHAWVIPVSYRDEIDYAHKIVCGERLFIRFKQSHLPSFERAFGPQRRPVMAQLQPYLLDDNHLRLNRSSL